METSGSPSGQNRVFQETLRQEANEVLLHWLRLGLTVGIVLYLGFASLDYLVASEHFGFLLTIRLMVVSLAALTVWATYSQWWRQYLLPVSVVMLFCAATGISIMTTRLGGFSSNYYFGILLVLFFVGLFMPWQLRLTIAFCTLVCLAYFGLNLFFQGPSMQMAPAGFFLLSTSVFTCLATEAGNRNRSSDLRLRLRLEYANKELTRIDQAKTRFFANVSHELRTPLTLMLGPTESLLREERDKGRKALLRSVLSNSKRLLRQVNLLLDTAKLESGRLTLNPVEADLGELLRDLIAASKPHAEHKGLVLEVTGTEDLGAFEFDYDKMEMVAANLLSNALKFTPPGGMILIRGAADSEFASFEVEDTGPGIPLGQRNSIFDRFHQVDTSLTREGGTGLGLSLARELARLHGGDIQVRSVVGQGSVFRVVVPKRLSSSLADRRTHARRKTDKLVLARAEALTAHEYEARLRTETLLADLRRSGEEETPVAGAIADPNAPRILVVDDNPELTSFLSGQLSRAYRVETASDGLEGLEAARKNQPDLVVCDIMMPRMDGHEFCRRLREDAGLAAVPVILVTARAGAEAVVEGLETGADDYVTKPFSVEELEARIAAHLRAKVVERDLHEKESRLAAIGQITSTVVHDLKNALMIVQGYSDLARSKSVSAGNPEEVVADLDQVKGATQRLRRMTSEILDFARGGTRLDLRPVSAKSFLLAIIEPLRTHLEGQGIDTEIDIDLASGLVIAVDSDRFQRVLENLVFNSRDAIRSAGGEGVVILHAGRKGDFLELRVADTGPGIEPELAVHLFQPFASKKPRGTGLGLATVRNLVKAHGGDVRVELTSPEGGAAFTVVLPVASEEEEKGVDLTPSHGDATSVGSLDEDRPN